MKKTYLILCILGVFLPYYNLINFLKINDWSMNGFFELLFSNYAVSMLNLKKHQNMLTKKLKKVFI